MGTTENKEIMREIFAELAKGNSQPLLQCLADDFRWIIKGTTKWSRIYDGKQSVLTELLQPLREHFGSQYTNKAHNFIAENDFVVVECQGNVVTKNGDDYNNSYCFICRLADGKLKEITEYCDTELVGKVLN